MDMSNVNQVPVTEQEMKPTSDCAVAVLLSTKHLSPELSGVSNTIFPQVAHYIISSKNVELYEITFFN